MSSHQSSGQSSPSRRSRLRLRGTFLDVRDSDVSLSPRASSEPRHASLQRVQSHDLERCMQRLDKVWAEGTVVTGPCWSEGAATSKSRDEPLHRGARQGGIGDTYCRGRSETLERDNVSCAVSSLEPQRSAYGHHGLRDKATQARSWREGHRENAWDACSEPTPRESRQSRSSWARRTPQERHKDRLNLQQSPTRTAKDVVKKDAKHEDDAVNDDIEQKRLLELLNGKWDVTKSSVAVGSVWTIDENGRALFNGKHFGNYDIWVSRDDAGSLIYQRGDGWSATVESLLSCDQLVWNNRSPTDGLDGETFIWQRRQPKIDASNASEGGGKTTKTSKTPLSHNELRSKMESSVQQMSEGWGTEKSISNAMAAMQEIPRRIGDDMQRAASHVVDKIQSETGVLSKHIKGNISDLDREATGDSDRDERRKVVKNLEAIPTMVQNLVEARVEKARAKVRWRVQGMITKLGAIQEENWQAEDHEQLMSEVKLMSEEVERIAGDAVEAAAQECHAHASRHVDFALTALRGDSSASDQPVSQIAMKDLPANPGVADGRNWWENSKETPTAQNVGRNWWENNADSENSKNAIEQAMQVVQDKDKKMMPQSMSNQVVADELLRAKVRTGGRGNHQEKSISGMQSRSSRSETLLRHRQSVANPGSSGHPELCARPCLYYFNGACKNGDDCGYCHLPHVKRPVRFDKRHREQLKTMPFKELVQVALPILTKKAQAIRISDNAHRILDELLKKFAEICRDRQPAELTSERLSVFSADTAVSAGVSAASSASSRSDKRPIGGIRQVLQVVGFRSLLTLLTAKLSEETNGTEVELLKSLLHEVYGRQPGSDEADVQEELLRKGGETPRGAGRSDVSSVSDSERLLL